MWVKVPASDQGSSWLNLSSGVELFQTSNKFLDDLGVCERAELATRLPRDIGAEGVFTPFIECSNSIERLIGDKEDVLFGCVPKGSREGYMNFIKHSYSHILNCHRFTDRQWWLKLNGTILQNA